MTPSATTLRDLDPVLDARRDLGLHLRGELADEAVDRLPGLVRVRRRERERHLGDLLTAWTDVEHSLAGERVDQPVERHARHLFDRLRELVHVHLALEPVECALGSAEGHGGNGIGGNAAEELRVVVRVASAGRARSHRDEQPVVLRGERRRQPVDTELDVLLRRLLEEGAELVREGADVDPDETDALVRKRVEPGRERLVAFERPLLERRAVLREVGFLLCNRDPTFHLAADGLLVAPREQRIELLLALRLDQDDRPQLRGGDDHDLVTERRSDVGFPIETFVGQPLLDRADDAVADARDPLEDGLCLLPLRRVCRRS